MVNICVYVFSPLPGGKLLVGLIPATIECFLIAFLVFFSGSFGLFLEASW